MNAANALNFSIRWEGRGKEKQDTVVFWTEFFQRVLEVPDVRDFAEFEKPVTVSGRYTGPRPKRLVHQGQGQLNLDGKPSRRKATQKSIDVYVPSAKVIVEQKTLGKDLDASYPQSDGECLTPVEQAIRYNNGLRSSEKARYVVTCNFEEFRIYDLDNQDDLLFSDFVSIKLSELKANVGKFDFLVRAHKEKLVSEKNLSVEAAQLMAKLRDRLAEQYELYGLKRGDLTKLMVRLLFCLYAEDSTLFSPDQFHDYLQDKVPDQQSATFRRALVDLFRTLDTPIDERGMLAGEVKAFPYVNGGLFSGEIDIPFFDEESKRILLDECCPFQWSEISPALFGSLFESVLSSEQRHDGGMHYTSIDNIHKLTTPLFLEGLDLEIRKAGNDQGLLRGLQDKIAGMRIFDPACGSGNFLTQSYIDLRRLENRILERLIDPMGTGQVGLGADATITPKVQIDHFYGIEVNDFAVHVAETAMQIAKHQMDIETAVILNRQISTLPLTKDTSIVEANALRTDWNDVLPAEECSFVVGNPPFLGARNQSPDQKAELKEVFHGSRNCGNVDYVAGWFVKAAEYTVGTHIRCAFVSTNSICQGEQAANVWKPIFDSGIHIDFAHDTFKWSNEASDQAHVFVVVVGFSREGGMKALYHHPRPDSDAEAVTVGNLNAYLMDAPDVLVWNRSEPMCNAPRMGIGSQPIDGGNYLFTPEEMKSFVEAEPGAKGLFRPWMGSNEFINGVSRFVLWLGDLSPKDLRALPKCMERVREVRRFRLASKRLQTKKAAERPSRFGTEIIPKGTSVLVPRVSSARRGYIPLGFVTPEVFCSDSALLISDASLYHFGVLHSRAHNAWMRVVCGRLKGDYRYSGGVVYNNFPWPGVDAGSLGTPVEELVAKNVRERIEGCAQAVLDARASYPECTIADLYDPDDDFLFPDLVKAHRELDAAVESAYGLGDGMEEREIVAHLLSLYAEVDKS